MTTVTKFDFIIRCIRFIVLKTFEKQAKTLPNFYRSRKSWHTNCEFVSGYQQKNILKPMKHSAKLFIVFISSFNFLLASSDVLLLERFTENHPLGYREPYDRLDESRVQERILKNREEREDQRDAIRIRNLDLERNSEREWRRSIDQRQEENQRRLERISDKFQERERFNNDRRSNDYDREIREHRRIDDSVRREEPEERREVDRHLERREEQKNADERRFRMDSGSRSRSVEARLDRRSNDERINLEDRNEATRTRQENREREQRSDRLREISREEELARIRDSRREESDTNRQREEGEAIMERRIRTDDSMWMEMAVDQIDQFKQKKSTAFIDLFQNSIPVVIGFLISYKMLRN